MSKIFRAKFVAGLRSQQICNQQLYDDLFKNDWVVYAKRPFGRLIQVIVYLGRYTHKVFISNHHITDITNKQICFNYKDYWEGNKTKTMTFHNEEFEREFSMHILTKRFVRIRDYGILNSVGNVENCNSYRKI